MVTRGPLPVLASDAERKSTGAVACDQTFGSQQRSGDNANAIPVDVPIFLQNTYRMVDYCNSCQPSIASWWSDGETFVIKDTQKLAFNVIPRFFKHNKFSSFVRQLNFYGFRKIKHDPYNVNVSDQESKHWRFRHEFFVRDRPDLIREIRRPSQNTVEREELESLKKEVNDLKDQVSFLMQHFHSLPHGSEPPALPKPSQQVKRSGDEVLREEPCQDHCGVKAKRRRRGSASMVITPPSSPRVDPHQAHVPISPQAVILPAPIPSLPPSHQTDEFDPAALSDEDLLVEDYVSAPPQPQCASVPETGAVPHDSMATPDDMTLPPPLCSPYDFFKLHLR